MNTRTLLPAAFFLPTVLFGHAAMADPPADGRSVYRFEIAITGIEEGAHAAPATYTMILQENQPGTVSTGANVPLHVGPGVPGAAAARQDVGLSLHFSYVLRGDVVLLTGHVEMSAAGPAQPGTAVTIHRMRADGTAPIPPGTNPALFTSVYDLSTRRRYEINVTARRVL